MTRDEAPSYRQTPDRPPTRRRRDLLRRRGNAIIEVALVLPILLYLTLGGVEFSYALYLKHCVQSAASEGARAAIPVTAQYSDITDRVQDAMRTTANISPPSYTCTTKSGSTTLTSGNFAALAAGDAITVSVQVQWGAVGLHTGALPAFLLPTTKIITGTAVMHKSQ